jgi:hypothetical protein
MVIVSTFGTRNDAQPSCRLFKITSNGISGSARKVPNIRLNCHNCVTRRAISVTLDNLKVTILSLLGFNRVEKGSLIRWSTTLFRITARANGAPFAVVFPLPPPPFAPQETVMFERLIQLIEVPHEPGLTYTQLFLSVSCL